MITKVFILIFYLICELISIFVEDVNFIGTGKSLSQALILESTNPHYDQRLFIDLPVQYMKTTRSEHGENMLCA